MVYTMLLEKRERFPRNLFCSFIFTNGFSSAVQHSILLNVSLAGVLLLQTLFIFEHFISPVKHLKPASAVTLFPPTNPFLFLLYKPYLALSTRASLNRLSKACPFCFWGAGCQNSSARLKGTLLLHYVFKAHALYFYFHLHL